MTTITHKQARELFEHSISEAVFFGKLKDLGITIAEPEPLAAMVKLAREIASEYRVYDGAPHDVWAALAALQHVVKVAKELPQFAFGDSWEEFIRLDDLLQLLGAAE